MGDLCSVCKSPVGNPDERAQNGMKPGMPTVCLACGDVAMLDDALGMRELKEDELEQLMADYPVVKLVRNDVLSKDATDGSSCPGCGGVLNIPIGQDPRSSVQPHNPGFCPACQAILLITFDLRLRLATDEERDELLRSPDLPPAVRHALLGATGIETEPRTCPSCFQTLRNVSRMGYQKAEAQPEPDDRTICDVCGAILVFTDDGGMRLATDEERAELLTTHPEVGDYINQVIAEASRRNQA
jgi:RNase P subunit RPR2